MELFVNIDVADLDMAIRFYERAVGLQLGRRLFEGTAAEMLGASSPIYLMMKQSGSSPSTHTSQVRNYQRHWTPVQGGSWLGRSPSYSWVSLKVKAKEFDQMMYELRDSLFSHYFRAELRNLRIVIC